MNTLLTLQPSAGLHYITEFASALDVIHLFQTCHTARNHPLYNEFQIELKSRAQLKKVIQELIYKNNIQAGQVYRRKDQKYICECSCVNVLVDSTYEVVIGSSFPLNVHRDRTILLHNSSIIKHYERVEGVTTIDMILHDKYKCPGSH